MEDLRVKRSIKYHGINNGKWSEGGQEIILDPQHIPLRQVPENIRFTVWESRIIGFLRDCLSGSWCYAPQHILVILSYDFRKPQEDRPYKTPQLPKAPDFISPFTHDFYTGGRNHSSANWLDNQLMQFDGSLDTRMMALGFEELPYKMPALVRIERARAELKPKIAGNTVIMQLTLDTSQDEPFYREVTE